MLTHTVFRSPYLKGLLRMQSTRVMIRSYSQQNENKEKNWKRSFSEFKNSVEMDLHSAQHGEKYYDHWDHGVYTCARCDNPLYSSEDKFKSHCRWPSFRQSITQDAIKQRKDYTYGMIRDEILCGNCGLHLGHVFEDGKESGDTHPNAKYRHCVLSMCLDFKKS